MLLYLIVLISLWKLFRVKVILEVSLRKGLKNILIVWLDFGKWVGSRTFQHPPCISSIHDCMKTKRKNLKKRKNKTYMDRFLQYVFFFFHNCHLFQCTIVFFCFHFFYFFFLLQLSSKHFLESSWLTSLRWEWDGLVRWEFFLLIALINSSRCDIFIFYFTHLIFPTSHFWNATLRELISLFTLYIVFFNKISQIQKLEDKKKIYCLTNT